MKTAKFLFILLLPLLFGQGVNGQQHEFAPIGAKWWYTKDASSSIEPRITYCKIEVLRDTIIKNKICKVLASCLSEGCINNLYYKYDFVYDSSGFVFLFIEALDSFSLLYNFNANTGDSWNTVLKSPFSILDTITIIVDSISFRNINNQILKVLHIHTKPNDYPQLGDSFLEGETIELLGNMNWMFPLRIMEDPHPGPFRCYEDSILGIYKKWDSLNCDSTWLLHQIDETKQETQICIFPTLCNEFITVKLSNSYQIHRYQIFNIQGQLTLEGELENNEQNINIDDINKGFYFIRIVIDEIEKTYKFFKF